MRLPDSFKFLRQTRLWQALSDRRYLARHRDRQSFYRAFAPPDALVFDIGANVGNYALIFERIGARVLAVEPQAALAAQLRRRFAHHPRVQIVQTALGPHQSTAVLHKAPGLTEIASLRPDVAARSRFAAEHPFSDSETVPVTTLDQLIADHGLPDFCKIDVEGFELAVLAGLSRPVPCLSLEFNREFWPEATQCLDRLAALGPYRFNYALGEATQLSVSSWLSAADLRSTLEQNPDPLLWGDLYARLA
jgi:FkbM family methyltransferase